MANLYNLVRSAWSTTDPSLANGIISLPGVFDSNLGTTKTVTLEYNAIKKAKLATGAAATAGVVTVVVSGTLTAGNSLSFSLSQDISALNNNLPDTYNALIQYTIKTGDTATTVGDALALMVNNLPFEATAVNTTGTVVITATTANPAIIGAEIQDQGANITVTNTTAGVKAIGAGADLLAAGIPEAVTGSVYTLYVLTYKTFKPDGDVDSVSERSDTITLYIGSTAGTSSGAYITALSNILNGLGAAGGTPTTTTLAGYFDVLT
jgi:hypothetical protein